MKNCITAAMLLAGMQSAGAAAESAKVYESVGADFHATATIVPADVENQYFIEFVGFEHEFDGTVALYEKIWKVPQGKSHGFTYRMVGLPFVNFQSEGKTILRSGSNVPYSEVFLADKAPTKVIYKGQPDIVHERSIRERYIKLQGFAESRVDAKRRIKASKTEAEADCSATFELRLNWSEFDGDNKATSGLIPHYLNALGNLCTVDDDHRVAIAGISTIAVKLASDAQPHSVELSGPTFTVAVSRNTANVPLASARLIQDVF